MRVVSWNINSVRLRINAVENFVEEYDPDILCLQEIKVSDDSYPISAFKEMGFSSHATFGQKGYHGVSTHSKIPITRVHKKYWCNKNDSRHLHLKLKNGVSLHNFYVPAGGDRPDIETNEKFAHKLKFLEEITKWFKKDKLNNNSILLGDLNIAPLETDVWSHKQLLKIVSHTPIETEYLNALMKSGLWVDAVRKIIPPEQKLYSWWSYRSPKWEVSDRGRRLDHIWVSPDLEKKVENALIAKSVRGWIKPSDHAPVIVDFSPNYFK